MFAEEDGAMEWKKCIHNRSRLAGCRKMVVIILTVRLRAIRKYFPFLIV